MEFSGQKRSNLLVAMLVWISISVWFLLKAIPYNIPLREVSSTSVYRTSVFYLVFAAGVLIIALLGRDYKLLYAYAIGCLLVLAALMLKEMEIAEERETLIKLRDGFVGFFLLPHWGWSRILKENIVKWIAAWSTFGGAVALYGGRIYGTRRKNLSADSFN